MIRRIIWWLIIGLALGLRLKDIAINPAGFQVDEAAIGFNAYSLMTTGADEYGQKWPVLLKSFGDYKPPVYSYLLMVGYKFLGVSVFSTRLVSVLAGVITIVIFGKIIFVLKRNQWLALLAMFLLATNPWHLMLSRGAFESNLGLMFLVIGWWSFYKNWWWLTVMAGVMAMMTYHSQRLIVPSFYLFLVVSNWKLITKDWPRVVKLVGWGLFLSLPLLMAISTPGFWMRAQETSVFKEGGWGRWWESYSSYFQPRFLWGSGDTNLKNNYPGLPPVWWWQIPLMILGLATIMKEKKHRGLIWWWLLLTPLPASMSSEMFGSVRALPFLLPLTWLTVEGVGVIEKKNKVIMGLLFLIVAVSLVKVKPAVFDQFNLKRFREWDYGVEAAIKEVEKLGTKRVVFDNRRKEIYVAVAFFKKVEPQKYQVMNGREENYYEKKEWNPNKVIDNIEMRPINWEKDLDNGVVLVGDLVAIDETKINKYNLKEIFRVTNPDGGIGYRGVVRSD